MSGLAVNRQQCSTLSCFVSAACNSGFSSLDANGFSKDAIRTDPAVGSAAIIADLESFAADGLYVQIFTSFPARRKGSVPFGRVCGLIESLNKAAKALPDEGVDIRASLPCVLLPFEWKGIFASSFCIRARLDYHAALCASRQSGFGSNRGSRRGCIRTGKGFERNPGTSALGHREPARNAGYLQLAIRDSAVKAAAEARPRHHAELPRSERPGDSAAHAEAGVQDCNAEQLRLLIVYLRRHHVVMDRIVECAPGAGKGRVWLLEILLARLPG
jgi:hypothetical protein